MGRAEVKEKYEHAEFPIHIIGRNVEVTDPMKAYAVNKMNDIVKRFKARVVEATIVMDIQRYIHNVNYVIEVNNLRIKVSGHTKDMYSAIDQAAGRLDAKLSRYHRRIHEHHDKHVQEREMNVNVVEATFNPIVDLNDEIEEANLIKAEEDLKPHQIVSKETKLLKTLNIPEAVMKMDLSGDAFLLFHSEEDHKLKLIYRRNDGNYGIIEPQV